MFLNAHVVYERPPSQKQFRRRNQSKLIRQKYGKNKSNQLKKEFKRKKMVKKILKVFMCVFLL